MIGKYAVMPFRASIAFHIMLNGFSLATALSDACSLNKGTSIASRPCLTPFSSECYNFDMLTFLSLVPVFAQLARYALFKTISKQS